jgi:hypothetical protein
MLCMLLSWQFHVRPAADPDQWIHSRVLLHLLHASAAPCTGRTQQENPGYSRGIRQRLENLTREWCREALYLCLKTQGRGDCKSC